MTAPAPSAFDPQEFAGTAGYYAAGRPPYSAQLADTLAGSCRWTGTGRLLDVGCGPGVLAPPLARLFDQVTALDPEPGMLQTGRRRCRRAGVANVRWVRGVADDIARLHPGSWRAVTFGQSFHRLRRLEVAEAVYDLLVPGGSLVLISHHVDDGRPRPANPGYPEVPHAAVRKLILEYLGERTRRYLATWDEGQPARF
jgi:ubiquinone/menaquinone biosynthesis C-methylase UbiE